MSSAVVSGVVADWSTPDEPSYTFTVTRQVVVEHPSLFTGGRTIVNKSETSFAPCDVPVEFRNAIIEWINRD